MRVEASPRRSRTFIGVLLAFATVQAVSAGLALAPGDPAPFLTGTDLSGEVSTIRWKDHAATIVNFWATWCEPCKEEMPALQALYARKAEEGLAIVGVHLLGSSRTEISAFVEETGARYPILLGDVNVAHKWTVGLLPTTFLVNGKGIVVRRYVGATSQQIEGLISDAEAFLDGRPLGTIASPEAPAVTQP